MRTEQLLRETLQDLADQARSPEVVLSRISAGLMRRPSRRRRTMVLVLAAVVVAALAIALPGFLINRTAVPADQRVPGNWNLIHRVDPPKGLVVQDRYVRPDWEATLLGPENATGLYGTLACEVGGFGPGVFVASIPDDASPVEVNGHPGFVVTGQFPDVPEGIYWTYAKDAWASATCQDNTDLALTIARRTTFGPQRFRVGLRLRALPHGFAADTVMQGTANGQPGSGLVLKAQDSNAEPSSITIGAFAGSATVPPGLPGFEEDRIAGHRAVLNGRELSLTLDVDGYVVRIEALGGEPADLTQSLWPAGRRELLVSVAEDLVLARDLGNPRTWLPAQRAFPG